MITYKGTIEKERIIKVYLEKKHVGSILCSDGKRYQYIPKGYGTEFGGEFFQSLEECKHSLEAE